MAEYLKLNGIAIPTLVEGAEHETQLLIDAERAQSMAMIENVEAEKGYWKHRLVPQKRDDAFAFRQLINGAGHYWPFDATPPGVYSTGGLGPQAQNGGALASDQKWLGAQSLKFLFSESGRNISFDALPANVPTGWTIAVAARISQWDHWLATSRDGTGANQWYKNGTQGFTPADYSISLNTSLGRVTLQGDVNTTWFDELIILPYAVPHAWVSQIYAFQNPGSGNTQWSQLRQLKLQGDVLPEGGTKIVHGRVTREGISPMVIGTFQPSARELEFELVEV